MINRTPYKSSLDANEKPGPNINYIYERSVRLCKGVRRKSKKTSAALVLSVRLAILHYALISFYTFLRPGYLVDSLLTLDKSLFVRLRAGIYSLPSGCKGYIFLERPSNKAWKALRITSTQDHTFDVLERCLSQPI